MLIYDNPKLAIQDLAKIDKKHLKRRPNFGMENDYIYLYKDRVFKITSSRQEFLASKRIIGRNFNNVVKIYDSFECDILGKYSDNIWKSYIIEEELLFRKGSKFLFKNLDICTLMNNVEKRLPYFVSIINGLIELESVGIKYKDLHCLNIMFDKSDNAKLIDFGYVSLKKDFGSIDIKLSLENYCCKI